MAIGFHVVSVDVGHDSHHGQQVQERRIGLVSLHHDVVARAQLGIGPSAVQATTDHKCRIQSSLAEHTGHQTGRGGLAMRAGNGHALLHAHQLCQHHGTGHDRDMALTGGQHLWIVGFDSGRSDHGIGVFHIGSRVPHVGSDAQSRQAAKRGAVGQV